MTIPELKEYIAEHFGVEGDHPWADEPGYTVFRHPHNRKWFALTMSVPGNRLGLDREESVPVVNVKCDPRIIGSARALPGVLPAYHMNKEHWLTIRLDGTAERETILSLLEQSRELTR